MTSQTATAPPPGRSATNPWRMPRAAWKQVIVRAWNESMEDNIGLVAAGVAFYAFLALVPLLAAIVLSYGLVANPHTVISDMQALTGVMPADAARLVGDQLMAIVRESSGKKGFGLLLALAISFYGARNGAYAIVTALNIAYEEEERRGFLFLNLLALLITGAMVVVMMMALFAVAALGYLEALLPAIPSGPIAIGRILAYAAMVLAGAAGAATLYRYGPDRARARWVWLTPGSLGSAVTWMLLTLGFSIYAANFGHYGATYGSLSAVIVLLTWLYFSSYILLLGAELNAELEHQTEYDTTTGAPMPLGRRGAWVADHVAGEDDGPTGGVSAGWSRAGRAGAVGGTEEIGVLPAALTVLGLAALRGRGGRPAGFALLAAGAGIAWLSRRRARDAGRPAKG